MSHFRRAPMFGERIVRAMRRFILDILDLPFLDRLMCLVGLAIVIFSIIGFLQALVHAWRLLN